MWPSESDVHLSGRAFSRCENVMWPSESDVAMMDNEMERMSLSKGSDPKEPSRWSLLQRAEMESIEGVSPLPW
jgi:hypothetical protein